MFQCQHLSVNMPLAPSLPPPKIVPDSHPKDQDLLV